VKQEAMSYDLFFYLRKGELLDADRLARWAEGYPPFTVHRHGAGAMDLDYANEQTETGFALSLNEPANPSEIAGRSFAEFEDAGLSFNINFSRPSYFIEEAVLVLEALTRTFALLVVDPQADDTQREGYAPHAFDGDRVKKAWRAGNAASTHAFAKMSGEPPLHIPAEKLTGWWRYTFHRQGLQERLGEGIFVPGIHLFYHVERKSPVMAMAWTDNIPTVFPPVDLVVLVRQRKKAFGLFKKLESGYVEAESFLKKVEAHLKPVEGEVDNLKYLPLENVEKTSAVFWSESIDENMDLLMGLSPLDCTDVPLEEND
jgi:hypothetical protein